MGALMMNSKKQQGGNHSTNFQGEVINFNSTGLSVADVKEIATDVFKSNFEVLKGQAKETAEERAVEITEKYLYELLEKNPAGINAAEDPDFQQSLFQVQKEYAKCGDKELGDLLVDILVDRSKEDQRNLRQIILNEALIVAPKLTTSQLDILACCFLLCNTKNTAVKNFGELIDYLEQNILLYNSSLSEKDIVYKHLEYLGCASIRTGSRDFVKILRETYKGLFCKGFNPELLDELVDENNDILKIVMPSIHDSSLVQAKGMDDMVVKLFANNFSSLSDNQVEKLLQINNQHMMSKLEVRSYLEKTYPTIKRFFKLIDTTPFKSLELTSVGIAIAHAYARKKNAIDLELSIWI